MTTAMYIVLYCHQVPDEYWNHDPELQNNNGDTVAMLLAERHIVPPKQWYHKPELQDNDGNTVAMYIAKYLKDEIPKELYHDPELKNKDGKTVRDILKENNKTIPNYWKET